MHLKTGTPNIVASPFLSHVRDRDRYNGESEQWQYTGIADFWVQAHRIRQSHSRRKVSVTQKSLKMFYYNELQYQCRIKSNCRPGNIKFAVSTYF